MKISEDVFTRQYCGTLMTEGYSIVRWNEVELSNRPTIGVNWVHALVVDVNRVTQLR